MSDDTKNGLLERALNQLALDASPAAQSALKVKLEPLATDLLLEWLVGDRRFETQSQQTEYWLSRFYDEIFVDEQPDPTRIFERFVISLPRASYISRLLRARRTAQWRESARQELQTQLNRVKDRAEAAEAEGQGHIQEYDISLSPGAAEELRVLYDRNSSFIPERERPRPPKPKAVYGNTRWLSIPAQTLLLLIKVLAPGATK